MKLTLTQFARLGGIARWKGIKKKDRSKIMKSVALAKIDKKGKKIFNGGTVDNELAR